MENISIVTRKFDLTDSIKEKIYAEFDAVNKYHLNIVNAKIILNIENAQQKRNVVEIHINIAHENMIILKQIDKDIYTAIDMLIDKLDRKLNRIHSKQVEHKSTFMEIAEIESKDIEIIQSNMQIHKPLDIEDAIELLNSKKDQMFFVFNDHDSKKRVIYKRKDGNIGIY